MSFTVHGITRIPAACAASTISTVVYGRYPASSTDPVCGSPCTGEMASASNDAAARTGSPAEVVDVDAAQPWRSARPADLEQSRVDQRHDDQPRLDFAYPLERAPVKALDAHVLDQPCLAYRVHRQLNELLPRSRLAGGAGLDLGLDVQAHAVVTAGAHLVNQREHVVELDDAGTRDGDLRVDDRVDPRIVGSAGTAVQHRQLGHRQVLDELADVGKFGVTRHRRIGVPAHHRVRPAIVRHDGSTVLGDLHVQFQRGDAQLQRVGERRQAALRSQAQTTAVGLNLQRGPIGRAIRRTPRHGGHQRSGNQDHGHQDGADRHRWPPELKPAHDRSLAAARARR